MRRSPWTLALAFAVAAAFAVALLSPIGKPPDAVETLSFPPGFRLKRMTIVSIGNRRGLAHLPRSVSLETTGEEVRAYLLDLSAFPTAAKGTESMLGASAAIAAGLEPPGDGLAGRAANFRTARFRLHRWPWGSSARYVLIVDSPGEAPVKVVVSYGR